LGGHLGELGARHPWWRRVRPLRASLADDSAHTRRLRTDWASYQGGQRAKARGERIGRVEDDLERIRTDLTAVARALGHPWRPHFLLWFREGRAP
uniref:hypothetical protein n=1 Tax=Actinomadura roseirufa TaxID=2094049 RepID=UPI0013F16F4B